MSLEDLRSTLSLLFREGQVVELRGSRKSGGMASGYYTDLNKLAQDAEVLDNTSDIGGLYVVLNEINPVLLSRRANRIDMRLLKDEKATGDEDIIHRDWFPIDIDPKIMQITGYSQKRIPNLHQISLQYPDRGA